MSIYQNIKKIANSKNIQQKDLAVAFGVTENTMTNYLTGRTKIIADHVPLFAKVLRVSIEEIYSGMEYRNIKGLEKKEDIQVDNNSCPECRPRIKKIKELEKEVRSLKDKVAVIQEKYTDCMEKLIAKKERPLENSA